MISGLIGKDYLFAFVALCIDIVLLTILVNSFKKTRMNNKLFKGLSDYQKYLFVARRSGTVSYFISNYDKAIEAAKVVASIEPDYLLNGMVAEGQIIELENKYQRELREVINNRRRDVLGELNHRYKHSLRNKEAAYNGFWQDINLNKERFSFNTKVYADEAINSVYKAAEPVQKVHYALSGRELTQDEITRISLYGTDFDNKRYEKSYEDSLIMSSQINDIMNEIESTIKKKESLKEVTHSSIVETDTMNGLEFESWCANVLRKNSFVNVRVTPASNDQGVDILAEKEGIKYAIQCKCYTADLSNTPVQEVNAGKKFYDCHVGVVMTNSHFTKGAIALAKKTGVLLWNREVVAQMASKSK